MTKKIFKGILNVSILTMLACLVFIIGVQYQLYDKSRSESLENQAFIIGRALDDGASPESFQDNEDRITVVEKDGSVSFDNKTDIRNMDNHSEREEIIAARNNGSGYSVRYSSTLSSRTCYYAVRLYNGKILRVSGSKLSVLAVLLQLLQPIAAIILFTAALALGLATVISKKILKPINDIDPERPEIDESYKELSPLIAKLNSQKRRIKKQIAELTKSKRQFEIISENMSEGMVLTDKDGIILSHNNSIEKFFDVSDGIDGKNILTLNRSEAFRSVLTGISDNKRSDSVLELSEYYYEVTGNPVFDESGNLCGAVVLVIDITEKEKRERLRQEFTANVSHELKTPLTSILGISDMLKNGIVNPGDVAGFSEDINKEAKRLISLVNDIIKLSELDEGASSGADEITDLNLVSKEVCERLSGVADANGITLQVAGETAEITAGSSLIFEMIYNLCDNAIKYNRKNGSVTVSTGKDGDARFVKVCDTGIGIPEEHLGRIFERFYRVDKSRSKQSGGTGLGLSIVKHIAAGVNGKISIKSTPDVGTEITVCFPENKEF